MKPPIIVLFDSDLIRQEVIQYSFELAKRMGSTLILLVILSIEGEKNILSAIHPMYERGVLAREILNGQIQTMEIGNVPVKVAIRLGDPRSELVKYLAENTRVQTIVWGGNPNVISRKDHWLVQMKDTLECPVVTPYKKATDS